MAKALTGRDLRELTVDDLKGKEDDLAQQLFKIRFQKALGQVEDPSRILKLRRSLARVKTILNEKARASVTGGAREDKS